MWWLWNQMFQYAIWKNIANKNWTELYLDCRSLSSNKDSFRACELTNFNVHFSEYTDPEINFSYNLKDFIRFYLNQQFLKHKIHIQQERTLSNIIWDWLHLNTHRFNFKKEFLKIKWDNYLIWFFQSPLYFEDIKKTIMNDFTPIKKPNKKNEGLINEIRKKEVLVPFTSVDETLTHIMVFFHFPTMKRP